MSKQVRLRRGTTAQHAAFTGADGEITFDTTKKILVLHDSSTPGGRPLEGWIAASIGNPLAPQTLHSTLIIAGGDPENFSLEVRHAAILNGGATVAHELIAHRLSHAHATIPYTSTTILDFALPSQTNYRTLSLAGNLTLATSGLAAGRQFTLRLIADASTRTLTFPVGWKFLGAAAPANLPANKSALLRLFAFGVTDADVLARYLVEP